MAGKESDPNGNGATTLSDAQMKFLASMMKNSKTKPDVDWDAVAAESSITPKASRERYRLMAIKFGWNKSGEGSSTAADSPKKAAASPNKAAGARVNKRTGRVGAAAPAKKGKGKKVVTDEEEQKANNGDVASSAMEEDSTVEA